VVDDEVVLVGVGVVRHGLGLRIDRGLVLEEVGLNDGDRADLEAEDQVVFG
jgi:hypothetical protein